MTAYLSLEMIAHGLRDGKIRATELVQKAVAAHEDVGEKLNAYKTWDGARALDHARAVDILLGSGRDLGPLMGIPVSVKDLFGIPGMPVFAGTDTAFPECYSAPGPLAARLLDQLAIVMGKTHTVEFAFGGLGVNAHWGTPLNPWSAATAARAPGGSSSGAGVSLAEGSALLALGTDTAGSVRVPASFCGQAALKTTFSRWENDQIVPLSASLDTPGLLARSVEDLAWGFAALDPHARQPVVARDLAGLRIGVPENFFWDGQDDILNGIQATLGKLEAAGAVLVKMVLPGCNEVFDIFRQGGLAAPELRAWMSRNCPDRIARLDPVVRARVEGAETISAHEYLRRREEFRLRSLTAGRVFEDCDVIACPTVTIAPPLLSEIADPDGYARANMMALRNTVIANLFGWCALSLPAGPDGLGLPTGLQLIAPPFTETALLATGSAVEKCIGMAPALLGQPNF